jgi:O-antigen ligase
MNKTFLNFAIWAMAFGVMPMLYDPINLPRLILLLGMSTFVLIQLINPRNKIAFNAKTLVVVFSIPLSMLISAIATDGSFFYDFTGYYQRFTGILAYLSLAFIVLFVSFSNLASINSVSKNLSFVIYFFGIYLLLQLVGLDPLKWVTPYNKLIGTFGNPNFSAAFIGILTPAVICAVMTKKNNWRYFDLVLFSGLIYLSIKTESIQGPLIIAFASICYAAILFYNHQKKLVALFSASVIFGFTVVLFSVLKIFTITPLNSFLLVQGSGAQRLDFWRAGTQMFTDHPLFGLGPDGYARHFQFYRTTEQVIRDGALNRADQAHSVPIQMFANGGLVLGIAYFIFVGFITWTLLKLIRQNENMKLVALFGSVWLSYLFQSLISIDTLALTFFGYFAGGIILALNQIDKSEKVLAGQRIKLVQKTLLVFGALGLGIGAFGLFISDVRFNALMKSSQINPSEAIKFSNAWPSARMSFLLTNVVQASGDFKSAEVIAKNAAKYDPLLPEAWYLIGVSRSEQSDSTQALQYVNKSLALDEFNTFFMLKKAYIQMDLQDFTSALETINEIKDLNPSQGGLPELVADYENRSKL